MELAAGLLDGRVGGELRFEVRQELVGLRPLAGAEAEVDLVQASCGGGSPGAAAAGPAAARRSSARPRESLRAARGRARSARGRPAGCVCAGAAGGLGVPQGTGGVADGRLGGRGWRGGRSSGLHGQREPAEPLEDLARLGRLVGGRGGHLAGQVVHARHGRPRRAVPPTRSRTRRRRMPSQRRGATTMPGRSPARRGPRTLRRGAACPRRTDDGGIRGDPIWDGGVLARAHDVLAVAGTLYRPWQKSAG